MIISLKFVKASSRDSNLSCSRDLFVKLLAQPNRIHYSMFKKPVSPLRKELPCDIFTAKLLSPFKKYLFLLLFYKNVTNIVIGNVATNIAIIK